MGARAFRSSAARRQLPTSNKRRIEGEAQNLHKHSLLLLFFLFKPLSSLLPFPFRRMLTSIATLAAFAGLASASPLFKRDAASFVGTLTTDIYPPPSATVNTAAFPNESEIGYPGVTQTGAFANALETAIAAPLHTNVRSARLITYSSRL